MNFVEKIERLTKEFIQTWNDRDFEKLRSFLVPGVVIRSPFVLKILPQSDSDTIQGIDPVMNYFKSLSEHAPQVRFNPDLKEFHKVNRTMRIQGELIDSGKPFQAEYQINEYGKFVRIELTYPEDI